MGTTSDETGSAIEVVVVDDSPEVCFLLGTILEMDGRFEVIGEAHTASAGIAMVSDLRPQLVLVDLQLGRRDGRWLIKEMRSRHSQAAVAVVTGSCSAHDHLAAYRAGADSIHNKTSMTSTMVDELADTVARRRGLVPA